MIALLSASFMELTWRSNLRKITCGNVHSLIYFGKVEIHFQIRSGTFLMDDITTILLAIEISKIKYQTLQ